MNYRIQSIPGDTGKTTYFIETKFGNLLLFADYMNQFDYSFYKSRGGVYLQYFESYKNLKPVHKEIFERLGATGISYDEFELEPPDLAMRNYCKGLDKEVQIIKFRSGNIAAIEQKDKKIWVLGNQFFFSKEDKIFIDAEDVTDEIYEQAENKDVSLILCSWHDAKSVIDLDS